MPLVGETGAKTRILRRLIADRPVNLLVQHYRGDRHVGRGELLRHDHYVGLDSVRLTSERVTGAVEAGYDLVGDHQHVVAPEHGLDLLPVGGRRRDRAPSAHHRLGDEGRERLWALVEDELLEFLGATRGERLLGLPVAGVPIVVVGTGVKEASDRQIEVLVRPR